MNCSEMTLAEWVAKLPDIHLAHREYDALRALVREMAIELDYLYVNHHNTNHVGSFYDCKRCEYPERALLERARKAVEGA